MKHQKRSEHREFQYIYKITRTDGSGKYYIGRHSTDNLDDGYFGSGTRISRSVKKHGKEGHIKEILEFLPSYEALKLREKELVNEELLVDRLCMNIVPGGEGGGGWSKENQSKNGKKGNAAKKILRETSPEWVKKVAKKQSEAQKESYNQGRRTSTGWSKKAVLMAASPEAIQRRKSTMALNQHMQGSKNSMFGKRWINKDNDLRLIEVTDLQKYLNDGWLAGRSKLLKKISKSELKDQELIKKVLCSGIDVTIPGWAPLMSTHLKMSRFGSKKFIKRCVPDLWQHCFIEINKRRN
jgi:hypothetical protein